MIIPSRNRNMLQNTYIVHILLYTTDLLFTANSSTSEKPSEYAHISIKFIYSKKVTKIWKKSPIFIWNSLVTSNELGDFFSNFCCLLVLFWEYRYDAKPLVVLLIFFCSFHLSCKNNDSVNIGTSFLLGGIPKLRWPNFSDYWPTYISVDIGGRNSFTVKNEILYIVDISSNPYLPHLVNVVWERPSFPLKIGLQDIINMNIMLFGI